MSLDLKQQSQRRMRLVIAGLVGVVVLLVAIVVGLILGGSGGKDSDAKAPAGGDSGRPPSSSHSKLPDDGGYSDPRHWVKLPKGAKKVHGLEVQFPHSAKGAAAMAAASTRNGWTFDADQVRRGIETYSVEKYEASMAAEADASAKGVRKFAGVPGGGAPAQDAHIQAWPIGVQWKQQSADRVQVFVLTRITSSAGDGAKSRTRVQSDPAAAVWEGGDWKLTPTSRGETPEAPDPADIGSPKFSQEGWKAIQEGGRGR